jgi:hypothetical protein
MNVIFKTTLTWGCSRAPLATSTTPHRERGRHRHFRGDFG